MRASSAADSYSNFFLSWLSLLPYPTTTTTCSNSSFKTTKDKNVVDLSTKKKTKSKKKVLVEVEEVKVETKNSKMNLPKRMTSDLLSMLEAKRRAASNVYVSHPIRHQTVLFTCILFATLTFASSPGMKSLLLLLNSYIIIFVSKKFLFWLYLYVCNNHNNNQNNQII